MIRMTLWSYTTLTDSAFGEARRPRLGPALDLFSFLALGPRMEDAMNQISPKHTIMSPMLIARAMGRGTPMTSPRNVNESSSVTR
jgi:hypothetical protein